MRGSKLRIRRAAGKERQQLLVTVGDGGIGWGSARSRIGELLPINTRSEDEAAAGEYTDELGKQGGIRLFQQESTGTAFDCGGEVFFGVEGGQHRDGGRLR